MWRSCRRRPQRFRHAECPVEEPVDTPMAEPTPDTARSPIPVGVYCPDCGYDLRSSTSDRCPECGFALDVLRTRESLIPWSHRQQLGWFGAYWKTVWQVARRPKKFSLEMLRQVSYADSQSFRWVTLLHAYLPILAASIAWLAVKCVTGRGGSGTVFIFAHVQFSALWLLVLLPGAGSYGFQLPGLSVDHQNRAIALSYYAWTPLAFMPLVVALATVAAWLATWSQVQALFDPVGAGASAACAMTLVWPYAVAGQFLRCGLRPFLSGRRTYRLVIGLLAFPVFLGAVLLPLILLYVGVIVYSFL